MFSNGFKSIFTKKKNIQEHAVFMLKGEAEDLLQSKGTTSVIFGLNHFLILSLCLQYRVDLILQMFSGIQ